MISTRKCSVKGCKEVATTFTGLKGWCGVDHGAILAEAALTKQRAEKEQKERAKYRVRKEAIKTRSEWVNETQAIFNKFRREECRLAGHGCISCGCALDWNGNAVDAGHYRSVGSAPHLRFVENNVWGQCKKCNRYGSGMAVDYRLGLIARIGREAVEALESDNTPRKWAIPELRAMKAEYQAKLKQLRANQQGAD